MGAGGRCSDHRGLARNGACHPPYLHATVRLHIRPIFFRSGGIKTLDAGIWLGIAIVIATFTGPLAAVKMTRHIDEKREKRARQLAVFRGLMGTRRSPLSDEHVKGLNLVEIEFYGVDAVQSAHRELMQHINTKPGDDNAWTERKRHLTTRLLSAMATALGYNLQQLDVLEGGYAPQRYADLEQEQQLVRHLLIEVLSARRPLAVAPAAPTPPSPFPPPPAPEEEPPAISAPVPVRRPK